MVYSVYFVVFDTSKGLWERNKVKGGSTLLMIHNVM